MSGSVQASVLSLFSGLGFLDLGFENAGFNIASVHELDPTYLFAYKYARDDVKEEKAEYHAEAVERLFEADRLSKLKASIKKKSATMHIGFIGGPPCPDFSVAGKNRGKEGKHGKLTESYIDLIIEVKPDFFLFENVKGLYSTTAHRIFYDQQKKKLEDAGYKLFESIENAIEYGVPQFRERLLLVGFRIEKYGERIPFSFGYAKQYDWDIVRRRNWPQTDPFEKDATRECPKRIYKKLTVEHWFQKNDVSNHQNAINQFKPRAIEKYWSIDEGDVSRKSFKRLHRWRYSPTAAYGNNEVHLHPYEPRRLSVAEALAVQSLPKSFCIAPSIPLSSMFKMIGNGVPYKLALGVAKSIMRSLVALEHGEVDDGNDGES